MKLKQIVPALSVAIVLLSSATQAAPTYRVTDLGALGGTYSIANGINDNGQVVGGASTPGNATINGFLYSGGSMTNLGALGSSTSDINNSGQIVGESYIAGGGTPHAFLYNGGSMIDLGTLGGAYSNPFDINNRNQVVGQSATAGNATMPSSTAAAV